eukprot:4940571-Pyramimonas_sp.AAC.1
MAECLFEDATRGFTVLGMPPLDLPEDVAPFSVPLDPYFILQHGREYACTALFSTLTPADGARGT